MAPDNPEKKFQSIRNPESGFMVVFVIIPSPLREWGEGKIPLDFNIVMLHIILKAIARIITW